MTPEAKKSGLMSLAQALGVTASAYIAAVIALGFFSTLAFQFQVPEGGGKGPDRSEGAFVCMGKSYTDYCSFDDMLLQGVARTAIFSLPLINVVSAPLGLSNPQKLLEYPFQYLVFPLIAYATILGLATVFYLSDKISKNKHLIITIVAWFITFGIACTSILYYFSANHLVF